MIPRKLFTVKITVSMRNYPGIPEATIYYRQKMTLDLLTEYGWYFRWMASLVQARHPHRKVSLACFDTTFPCGEDWIRGNLPKRLMSKRRQLAAQNRKASTPEDLFGIGAEKAARKAETIRREIERLENGDYDYYVPPAYINDIRKWSGREKPDRK